MRRNRRRSVRHSSGSGRTFGQQRLAIGLSQEDAARAAGMTKSHPGKIERAAEGVNPGIETLYRISEALRVMPQELLSGVDEEPTSPLSRSARRTRPLSAEP